MRIKRVSLSRTAAGICGLLLPIPFFVELMTGAPANASLRTGIVPPVPVSVLASLMGVILIIRRLGVVVSVLRRSFAAASMICYFGLIGLAAVAAGLYSLRHSLFAAQLFFPIWAFLLLVVISQDEALLGAFAKGLRLGLGVAITFILTALVTDWRGFILAGRIDQYEAPLRGMYQVGNYTPLGLVYAGGLSLALSRMPGADSKASIGLLALLTGALLFGSRDALLVAVAVGSAYAFLRPTTYLVARAATGLLVVGALIMIWMTSAELRYPPEVRIASVERLFAEGADEKRADLLKERGIDVIMGGGIGGQMLSGQSSRSELERESSHNFYVDLLVDWGILGVILIAFILRGTVVACVIPVAGPVVRPNAIRLREPRFLAAITVLGIALISSNVRTPYSQPFPASIALAAVGLLVGLGARSRREFQSGREGTSAVGHASFVPPQPSQGLSR